MQLNQPYVPGYGPIEAKLMIIGIAPGHEEEQQGRPFVGPSGKILAQDCREAGFNLNDAFRTNIFKYKLPGNEFYRHEELGLNIRDALADLEQEIYQVKPNCILGLGEPVLHTLTNKKGINKWRGSIIQAYGVKFVSTWHPAAELHGSTEGVWRTWQRYVRKFDIKRAFEESKSKELELKSRLLHVAHSSSQVMQFLDRNRNEKYCAVDIESIENIPVCIGLSFHDSEGFSIPLWNSLHISCTNKVKPKSSYNYTLKVSTIPDGDLAFIWQRLAEFFSSDVKFIGQNFKYDQAKLNNIGFQIKLYWDTLIGQHCISSELPKSLAFQQSVYTREPYHKDEGKNFTPGKDNIDELFLYNAKDAVVTRELFDVHYKELSEIPYGIEHAEWRMQLHDLYLSIDNTGFKVDENQRKFLIHKYVDKVIELEKEMVSLVGRNVNANSPKQVSELLYDELKIPRRQGTGEQVLTGLLANVIKKEEYRRVCVNILDQRRVNKTLGYLKASPDYDGRMKTNYQISGTENYRTSTNILEPPVRPEQIGWAFQTITKHGDIGHDLRSILVADIGFVLVNIDLSQAEARVCSLLADDEQTLKEYDTIDKHAMTAAKFFGGKTEQYSKSILGYECPERFVGKTLRHAFHLGIGKNEAAINVNTDARKYGININLSAWKAGECLKALEKDTPRIPEIFHRGIQEALRNNRRIHGTYGASRYFYDDEGRDLWKGAYAFIPQQTVSDKTKQVALKIYNNLKDIKIVVEAHDALTMLVPEKVLDERIEEIDEYFKEPIDFADCSLARRPLVIPHEVEIGLTYEKLSKYRKKVLTNG